MSRAFVRWCFAITFLLCLPPALSDLRHTFRLKLPDFDVYFTAASLIHDGSGVHIYDGATDGTDPQLRYSDANTVFARQAYRLGVDRIQLYVYPPTLADLLAPLTPIPLTPAEMMWTGLNLAALLGVTMMLAGMLGLRRLGLAACGMWLCLFLFRPTLECLFWGQVTILLLFLLVAGFSLYAHDRKLLAGLFFALAIAIKLTPLILVIPFLAFRDWKMIRAIAFWTALMAGAVLLINGKDVISLYVEHVLPSMSAGRVSLNNRNLNSMLQVFRAGSVPDAPAKMLETASKILSLAIVVCAGWLSMRYRNADVGQRVGVLSLFMLLACCLSPVSWRHAFVLAFPALVFLAKRAWDGHAHAIDTLLAALFVVLISSFGFNTVAQSKGWPILYDLAALTPLVVIGLFFFQLVHLRQEAVPGAGERGELQSA